MGDLQKFGSDPGSLSQVVLIGPVTVPSDVEGQVAEFGGTAGPGSTGTVIHPDVLTDEVAIGRSTALGKFTVEGDDAAQITAVIRAEAGQTADIFVVEDNAGTDIFVVDTSGATVTGKLTVTGAIDPTEIILSGGGTAHFMEWANGTTAAIRLQKPFPESQRSPLRTLKPSREDFRIRLQEQVPPK